MKYEDIIPALAEKLGVSDLEPQDGVCSLSIDGMIITIAKVADGEGILLNASVGEPPPEGADAFSSILLQANHEFAGVDGAMFSQNPVTKAYLLERILPLELIDADYLSVALDEFVNAVERWSKALEDFRPAAAKAKDADTRPDVTKGFMVV